MVDGSDVGSNSPGPDQWLSATEAKKRLGTLVKTVNEDRGAVGITARGGSEAVLISVEDYRMWRKISELVERRGGGTETTRELAVAELDLGL